MFDDYVNTQTTNAGSIEVDFVADNCDRVALFNLDATDVDLNLYDDSTSPSTLVMTKNIDLSTDIGTYKSWVVEEIYIYANSTLHVDINKSGSTAKCGTCHIGRSTLLGTTRYGAQVGATDYSIKSTDSFGRTYLAAGSWAKELSLKIHFDYDTIDAVFEDLVDARGTLVVVEANEDETDLEALRVLCFLPDWRIDISNPTLAFCDLTLRGSV
jgi:hypothetical protein